MKTSHYKIESQTGRVRMIQSNILIQDTRDMPMVEFWEERLKLLNQPYMIVYREQDGVILYSIFTDLRKKGSAFR